MANIDRIVNVQIALQTAAITTLSFSDLLLLGTFVPQANERVIIITSPDQLRQDYGVPTSSNLYQAALVAFSQIPTVPQLYIGQKDSSALPAHGLTISDLSPYWMEQGQTGDKNFDMTITGTGFTPSSKVKFGGTVEQLTEFVSDTELVLNITTALFTGIDEIPVKVIDTFGESNTLLFAVVATGSGQPPQPTPPAPDPVSPVNIIGAINDENSAWYAFCDTDHIEADATSYADWAEGNSKLFVTTLIDTNNLTPPTSDTTSVAAQLQNGNHFRTAWWYHPDPQQFIDVAIACKSFTKYPGGETWANQRLSAVDVVKMSETNARNVFGKNGNTFEPFRNINITQNGKVAGGEWIDVIRFRDWLCEEIRTTIFNQLVDTRIPYTDPGIAVIRSRLAQALDLGVARGGIAPAEIDGEGRVIPSYTISMPLSANISSANKAKRLLQDVYFTARLAGAIHIVEVKGVLTYEMTAVPVAA